MVLSVKMAVVWIEDSDCVLEEKDDREVWIGFEVSLTRVEVGLLDDVVWIMVVGLGLGLRD